MYSGVIIIIYVLGCEQNIYCKIEQTKMTKQCDNIYINILICMFMITFSTLS